MALFLERVAFETRAHVLLCLIRPIAVCTLLSCLIGGRALTHQQTPYPVFS